MRTFLSLLSMILIYSSIASANDGIYGTAGNVIDGDTLFVCDKNVCTRIRLCGIDAPEKGTQNYKDATQALAMPVRDKAVRCIFVGSGTVCDGLSKRKSRNRTVAQCFVGDRDIAADLVRQGHACDWPKFSGSHYRKIQGACSRE